MGVSLLLLVLLLFYVRVLVSCCRLDTALISGGNAQAFRIRTLSIVQFCQQMLHVDGSGFGSD